MQEHDQHQSFIKTPRQLIVTILLAFLVPIIGIILLIQLILSPEVNPPNPQAMAPEAVAARIQPVGRLEFGAAAAAPGARSGEAIVQAVCAACHQAGVAGAPKLGDAAAWAPRVKQGLNAMVQTVLKGKGAMPPKGGDASLTDDEIRRAVTFIANLKEKPVPAKPQAAAPAAHGKAVYDKVCFACHAQSVAGSPKLGDKAAWAPRLQTGTDALVQSVLKGKGAMPPKGGNAALSDAEVRSAVEFMVSQSK